MARIPGMAGEDVKAVGRDVESFLASAAPASPLVTRTKKRRRHRDTKKVDVSINSLLDVLSVILVFLMKSYSATTVQVKPSNELQVPFTHSAANVEESLAITITAKHVLLDDQPVIALDNRKVPDAVLSDGGMLIDPLLAQLKEAVTLKQKVAMVNKKAEFKGIVSFIVDRHTPFPLVTQAMYTAGQAGLSTFRFVLIKTERGI